MGFAYLTRDLPGTEGLIKTRREDFVVDEIPLYAPCGEGEHLFLHVRKEGIGSFEAIRRIAEALSIREGAIGYAGLKDARAVTTQWLSVPATKEKDVARLAIPRVEILAARRHGNKLRIGHLRGNRFAIVVRNAVRGAAERARSILDVLVRAGAPNYFGAQRFGSRGTTFLAGEAIVRRDYDEFVRRFLGGPSGPEVDPQLLHARELFDEGRIKEAYQTMPTRRRAEKKCLHALLRFEDTERACFAIPKRMRQMYVSSFQSWLFNRIVDRRVDGIDRLEDGDLAFLHKNHRVFLVEDAAKEQPRCRAFELSPSAPLFGTRAPLAEGEPGRIERAVLAETGLAREDFDAGPGMTFKGLRRPLRMPLKEVSLTPLDPWSYRLEFALPAGCFATSVLREITKSREGELPASA